MGGEPLLRDDLGPIVQHLKRLGLHTSANTNGWFVEERLEDLAGLDLVCMTLDGPPGVHDDQRRKGSYGRVLRSIEALRKSGVQVVTMTVVTSRGAERWSTCSTSRAALTSARSSRSSTTPAWMCSCQWVPSSRRRGSRPWHATSWS